VLTQHETVGVDGRWRSFASMSTVGVLAGLVVSSQGGLNWPTASIGWWGLGLLTFLYGTAFTIMFTVLPKLGVVGNSAIMNVEPIFALVLAWALLDQSIAATQLVGAAIVVATVLWLGLRKP
jgi:drug/metabolite transporter (DMT)-like permease